MATTQPTIYRDAMDKGLEGVVACSTQVSAIEGATLCYRGYTIEDLVEQSNFEETVWLLWNGKLPTAQELSEFKKSLEKAMTLDAPYLQLLKSYVQSFPKDGHPMDFLRSAMSMLSAFDAQTNDSSDAANRQKALRMTAKIGTIVAAFYRMRNGQDAIAPQSGKSMAWNFLNMLFGKAPSADHEKIFDTALMLHADHEINCSAFSARVTSSSMSDIYSAVVSAIGTLKGPLHGGANEQVVYMLQKIGSMANVEAFIEGALSGKQKIMGIGHRVYKNGDPRARILRAISERVTKEAGKPELYQMSVKIDDTMQAKKGLMPNVDFYSASVYHCMGIPTELFTPIFAVSRVAGWCAHVFEQNANNRIYRPRGEYKGNTGLTYVAVSKR